MPNGRPLRDVLPVYLLAIVAVGGLAGCQRLPLRRPLEDTLATGPAPTVTGNVTAPPPTPIDPTPAPAPTPLLDAAIARAKGPEIIAETPVWEEPPKPMETPVAPPRVELVSFEEPPKETAPSAPSTAVTSQPAPAQPDAGEPKPLPMELLPTTPVASLDPEPKPAPAASADPVLPPPVAAEPVVESKPSPLIPPTEPATLLAPATETPKPIDADKPVTKTSSAPLPVPADDWDNHLGRLRELARAKASEPGNEAVSWKGRLRVIDGLAEAGRSDTLMARVMPALSVATDPETTDPGVVNARLREAADAIDSLAPLEIVELQLCRRVQAFGVFEPLDATSLRTGQPFVIYCELVGLRSDKAGEEFHSKLTSRVELVERGGSRPVWSDLLGKDDLCRRRRRDVFVNYRITLPATLRPGDYELRLTQTDELAKHSVAAALDVRIVP